MRIQGGESTDRQGSTRSRKCQTQPRPEVFVGAQPVLCRRAREAGHHADLYRTLCILSGPALCGLMRIQGGARSRRDRATASRNLCLKPSLARTRVARSLSVLFSICSCSVLARQKRCEPCDRLNVEQCIFRIRGARRLPPSHFSDFGVSDTQPLVVLKK